MESTFNKSASVFDLATPTVLINETKLRRNLSTMQRLAEQKQICLRPDVNAHRCKAIAKMQIEMGAFGLSTNSVSDAIALSGDCDDWFITQPLEKLEDLKTVTYLKEKCRVILSVASYDQLTFLGNFFGKKGKVQDVMIQFDAGIRGGGISRSEFLKFCQEVSRHSHVRPIGIFTQEAPLYQLTTRIEAEQTLLKISRHLQNLADQFEKVVGYAPIVSLSSSITAALATAEHGFSELRPGGYVFGDSRLFNMGIMKPEQASLSVLAKVLFIKADSRIVIDSGYQALPFARHQGLNYGIVIGDPSARWIEINENTSVFRSITKYKSGDKIEIIPSSSWGFATKHPSSCARVIPS